MDDEVYNKIMIEITALRNEVSELRVDVEQTNKRAAQDLEHVYAAIKRNRTIN